MRIRGKRGEIGRAVLLTLAGAGVIALAVAAPNMIKLLKPLIEKQKKGRINQESLRRAVEKLRERRLITISAIGGRTILEITEDGKKRLREFDFDCLELETPKKWNGKWTVVLFDIPEHKKVARDALRRKLKELGCYQYNRSVFVHPASCGDEIDFVTEFFDISRYVSHFETPALGAQEYKARKYFCLF